MTIDEFLDSGAFVETKEGPHFCQIGKYYVLYVNGQSGLVRASVTYGVSRKTMVFSMAEESALPIGPGRLERIEDATEDRLLRVSSPRPPRLGPSVLGLGGRDSEAPPPVVGLSVRMALASLLRKAKLRKRAA